MKAFIVREPRSRQSGSILIFCLGFLVFSILAIGYSFNVSVISSEKTRLQNTSDAAAYSVAAVESRDLNFKAYTNRAMVANQVAIAQSISILSWTRFVDRFVKNISYITSFFPPLRAVFAGISSAVSSATRGLDSALGFAITSINYLEQVLSTAQLTHHVGTVFISKDIFETVVKKNDPGVDRSITLRNLAFIEKYISEHREFTKRYDPNQVNTQNRKTFQGNKIYKTHKKRMDEFRSVTLKSRDGFSKNRTYNWIGSTYIPWNFKVKIRKTGGSELTGSASDPTKTGNHYTWSALDTLSFHGKAWSCSWSGCGWSSWREFLPIGWGAAATGGQRKFNFFRGLGGRNRYASSFRSNRWASRLAASEYQGQRATGIFDGLRAFYDIRKDGLVSEGPGVAVMLTKPHGKNALETVKQTGFGGGSGQLNIEEAGGLFRNRLTALSQAVPYFSRPNDVSVFRRADRRREYGNLYNPFWQPRLTELRDKGRLLRLAATLP